MLRHTPTRYGCLPGSGGSGRDRVPDATRPNLLAAMDRAAADLAADDLLLLTYSGHGASLPDRGGDELDQRDEAWCLHDGLLLDDEIHHRLCTFAAGVRVLVVSDSCFSGSVTRRIRRHPRRPRSVARLPCGIILLAACEDRQTAHDGELHGLFTAALLATWNGGALAGGHGAFLAAIRTRVGAAQTPTLFPVGAVEPAFLAARPFTP